MSPPPTILPHPPTSPITTKCACPCRHLHRLLTRALTQYPQSSPPRPPVSIEQVLTAFNEDGERTPRQWNGFVDCILDNMTSTNAEQEKIRLEQCTCCLRHSNKDSEN